MGSRSEDALALRVSEFRGKYVFGKLVQPRVGLVRYTQTIGVRLREPDLVGVTAAMGDLSFVRRSIQSGPVRAGTGGGAEAEIAWVRAVVEAAERYACLVYDESDFIVDSADRLGQDALDLDGLPRCSARELSDPRCPVRDADKTQPIRWLKGYSLAKRRTIFVPAIMAHLSMLPWPAERFWLQISTGVAAHTDLFSALVAAVCECVERDAIALTWLGRLPLRRIEPCEADAGAELPILRAIEGSGIQFDCFDATTDLRIPTVFSVQTPRDRGDAPVSVSCATSIDLQAALRKAIREAGPLRSILYRQHEVPSRIDDFTEVIHGAAYHCDGRDLSAFDFLLAPDRAVIAPPGPCSPHLAALSGPRSVLGALVEIFEGHGMDVIVVDLTPDELRDVGLCVVKAIITGLVPMSFVHRARFLATPRLRSYVELACGRPFREDDVNPSPMPFA